MDLFHFTHQPGVRGIIKTGLILASDTSVPPEGDKIKSFGVHLTSDTTPDGHGLPDGRIVNKAQSKKLPQVEQRDGKLYCLDHREFRLRVKLEGHHPNLVKFTSLPGMTQLFALAADVAAHTPVPFATEAEYVDELNSLKSSFENQPDLRRSHTWWIYRGDLPLQLVSHVAYRLDDGSYSEGTLEQFLDAAGES